MSISNEAATEDGRFMFWTLNRFRPLLGPCCLECCSIMLGRGVIELFAAVKGIATVLLVALAGWQLWLLRQEAQRKRRP